MSEILITGFEMPPKDDTYGLHLVIYPNGDVWIAYDDKPTGKAKEVPTHGDLIDRQKLLEHRFEVYDSNEEVCEDYIETYHVLEAPTIIEASTSPAGFCNTEGCSNSKPDMTKSQNHICPYYQGVCSLDKKIICYCQYRYEMCDKFVEASKE